MNNKNMLLLMLQNMNQKMRNVIRRRFVSDDFDLETSDYMTRYLLSSSVTELAPSSSGLNVLERNRVLTNDNNNINDSGSNNNILTRIKNSVMKSVTFVSNARYLIYYNQNYLSTSTLNIKSDYRNVLVLNENNNRNSTTVVVDSRAVDTSAVTTSNINPVKFYIDSVVDAVGSIMDEYRESGYRSVEEIISNTTSTMAQNKRLVESMNMVVMSEQSQTMVRGIGATKETLQSIYLAGVEIAQESSDKFKSIATDNKWVLPSLPVVSTFPSFPTIDFNLKWPWDIYYRGDIPFFENFNTSFYQGTSSSSSSIPQLMPPSISTRDIINSMIEAEKKLNDEETSITSTSIIPLDSTDSSLPKGVKARIIRMLFPVSSLVLKGVRFVFSNRMDNFTISSTDVLRTNFDDDSLQQSLAPSINSNRSIDDDYSDLFTNDISAISTAWELANPSPAAIDETFNTDESNEGYIVASPKNIVVYTLGKLLISVPVYHVFNAYKYIRKMNRFRKVDRNEIVKLAIEDAKRAVINDNDDDVDDDKDKSMNSEVPFEVCTLHYTVCYI